MRVFLASVVFGLGLAACAEPLTLGLADGSADDRGTAGRADTLAPADAVAPTDSGEPADMGQVTDLGTTHDAAHEDATAEDAVPRDVAAPDAVLHDAAAPDAAPHDAAPRDAAPHDAAPHDAAGHDAAGHDATPLDAASQDAAAPFDAGFPITCRRTADCPHGQMCWGLPGCVIPWTCIPQHACTRDAVPYCSCRGVTVIGSSTCPPEPYSALGHCPPPGGDAGVGDAGGGVLGSLCAMHGDCMQGLLCCYPCGIPGCQNRCILPAPGGMCPHFP